MKLTFKRAEIMKLIKAELAGPCGAKPYTGEGWDTRAVKSHGLVLVGDQGIYFVCNRKMEKSPSELGLVAYAQESDPTNKTDEEFDDWYGVKNEAFGGDDGCEFVTAKNIQKWLGACKDQTLMFMDLTPRGYTLLGR